MHDEIKAERGRGQFLAHGVLFVPDDSLFPLTDALRQFRKNHNFFGEIHWREIKSATHKSKPFLVAQDWVEYYIKTAIRSCPFKAFIVEDGPNHRFPYPGDSKYPEHSLHSTQSTFVGGIAWSFYRESKLRVDMVFDESDNEVDRAIGSELSPLLQRECNARRLQSSRRYPWTRVSPVRFVSSNPLRVAPEDERVCECIQLCDLLLGASFQALDLLDAPDKAGRRQLAKSVLEVLGDTLRTPWLQQAPVHRKFSVSLYPDKYNFAYPAALRIGKRQEVGTQLRLRFKKTKVAKSRSSSVQRRATPKLKADG